MVAIVETPPTLTVRVEPARAGDLPAFVAMEQAPDTRDLVIPYALATHAERLADPGIVYLRILAGQELAGFFILALDADGRSVEFRRIVVAAKGRGVGQEAIAAMEAYCRTTLRRTRIWLDVFEHNTRARHVYEKQGYVRFGESAHEGERLLLYQKSL